MLKICWTLRVLGAGTAVRTDDFRWVGVGGGGWGCGWVGAWCIYSAPRSSLLNMANQRPLPRRMWYRSIARA